jgi:hypothetical protein
MGEDSGLAIVEKELSQRRCLADWSRGEQCMCSLKLLYRLL